MHAIWRGIKIPAFPVDGKEARICIAQMRAFLLKFLAPVDADRKEKREHKRNRTGKQCKGKRWIKRRQVFRKQVHLH